MQLLTVSPRWGFLTSSPLPPKKVLMSGHVWELLFSLACRIHALWTEKERENLRAEVPRVRSPETTLPVYGWWHAELMGRR